MGCAVSVNDLAVRMPRPLQNGDLIDLGGKTVRYIATPHVPHGWDAGLLFEETTRTLLCGDLFTRMGDVPARTSGDIIGPAFEAENEYLATSLTPRTASTILALKAFAPRVLALMHGSAFEGNCDDALTSLAQGYDQRLRQALG